MLEVTADAAPWWFVTLLTGVLAIVSTLVGAMISSRSARQSDLRRMSHEADVRRIEASARSAAELRESAGQFLVEARRFVQGYRANFRRVVQSGVPTEFRPVEAPTTNDITPVYSAYWKVVLCGSEEQKRAAKLLLRATRRFEVRAAVDDGWVWLSDSQYKSASDSYVTARNTFVTAMQSTAQA